MREGLQKLPEDKRDFNFGAVFKLPKLSELPEEFEVARPLVIKNQGESDMCAAYALTAVSEDQEEVELNPEYQFAKIKQIEGNYETWGANLRDACKSAVKFGSVKQTDINDIIKVADINMSNWRNWPISYDELAREHAKESYFSVDGPYDAFDNIRVVLWANRGQKRSILTGITWKNSWTGAEGGIINKISEEKGLGHAFKIFGWKGEFLKVQLSNGTGIGDNGIFYISREVANKELTYGIYTFKDMPVEKVKYLLYNNIKVGDNWLIRLFKLLAKRLKTNEKIHNSFSDFIRIRCH